MTPFEKQGPLWRKPTYLGGTHLLSEHSLGSYTTPGPVPGAVGAGETPEQPASRRKASEETDEMGVQGYRRQEPGQWVPRGVTGGGDL